MTSIRAGLSLLLGLAASIVLLLVGRFWKPRGKPLRMPQEREN